MATTRSTIRTRIQRRLGDTNSTPFYATAFYNDIIDSRVQTWAGLVCRLAPNWYLEHTNFTGVDDAADSTNEFYNFPADYRAFVQLERQYGTGSGRVYQPLRIVNAEDQDRWRLYDVGLLSLPDSLTSYEQVVSIWGTQLRIVPAPSNNNYEYRLKYIRRPVALAADESNLDIPDEWMEVIVLDSAIYVMAQRGDPNAALLMELRDREVKMLRDEHRRMNASSTGMPYMDQIAF